MKKYTTVQQVIDYFLADLTSDELAQLKKINDVIVLHHSVGRYIRNEFSLWSLDSEAAQLKADIWRLTPDNRKEVYNKHWETWGNGEQYKEETMHPDDASHELLSLIIKELK